MLSDSSHTFGKTFQKLASLNPWWLIALAGITRLLFLVAFLITSDWPNYSPLNGATLQQAGSDGYLQIARTLLISGEYAFSPGESPVPFRPPVLPFLMAIFGAWSPEYWHLVWLSFSLTIGTATAWVAWHCAKAAELTPILTRLLILAIALHPYLIFSTRVPGLPTTLTFLTTLVLYYIIRFTQSNGRRRIGLGLSWGTAALCHGAFLPLLAPFLAVLMIAIHGSWQERMKKILTLAAIPLFMIAPWTVRNHLAFDRFIPVATGGALQYWIGDLIYFNGEKNTGNIYAPTAADFKKQHGHDLVITHGGILDLNDDSLLGDAAKQHIIANPSLLIKRLAKGSILFWTTMDRGLRKAIMVGFSNLLYLVAYFIILGLAIAKRTSDKTWIVCQFFVLGFWSLFALVQAIGPYFVAITPCFLFLLFKGWHILYMPPSNKPAVR